MMSEADPTHVNGGHPANGTANGVAKIPTITKADNDADAALHALGAKIADGAMKAAESHSESTPGTPADLASPASATTPRNSLVDESEAAEKAGDGRPTAPQIDDATLLRKLSVHQTTNARPVDVSPPTVESSDDTAAEPTSGEPPNVRETVAKPSELSHGSDGSPTRKFEFVRVESVEKEPAPTTELPSNASGEIIVIPAGSTEPAAAASADASVGSPHAKIFAQDLAEIFAPTPIVEKLSTTTDTDTSEEALKANNVTADEILVILDDGAASAPPPPSEAVGPAEHIEEPRPSEESTNESEAEQDPSVESRSSAPSAPTESLEESQKDEQALEEPKQEAGSTANESSHATHEDQSKSMASAEIKSEPSDHEPTECHNDQKAGCDHVELISVQDKPQSSDESPAESEEKFEVDATPSRPSEPQPIEEIGTDHADASERGDDVETPATVVNASAVESSTVAQPVTVILTVENESTDQLSHNESVSSNTVEPSTKGAIEATKGPLDLSSIGQLAEVEPSDELDSAEPVPHVASQADHEPVDGKPIELPGETEADEPKERRAERAVGSEEEEAQRRQVTADPPEQWAQPLDVRDHIKVRPAVREGTESEAETTLPAETNSETKSEATPASKTATETEPHVELKAEHPVESGPEPSLEAQHEAQAEKSIEAEEQHTVSELDVPSERRQEAGRVSGQPEADEPNAVEFGKDSGQVDVNTSSQKIIDSSSHYVEAPEADEVVEPALTAVSEQAAEAPPHSDRSHASLSQEIDDEKIAEADEEPKPLETRQSDFSPQTEELCRPEDTADHSEKVDRDVERPQDHIPDQEGPIENVRTIADESSAPPSIPPTPLVEPARPTVAAVVQSVCGEQPASAGPPTPPYGEPPAVPTAVAPVESTPEPAVPQPPAKSLDEPWVSQQSTTVQEHAQPDSDKPQRPLPAVQQATPVAVAAVEPNQTPPSQPESVAHSTPADSTSDEDAAPKKRASGANGGGGPAGFFRKRCTIL